MNGLSMMFWATVYELYGAVRYPGRKWTMECEFCNEIHSARSYNMVLLKDSLHVHFTEDEEHPNGEEEYEGDWDSPEKEPKQVAAGGWGVTDNA